MIRLRGHLVCTNTEELALLQTHVDEHIRLSRSEPGCLSFEITATDDPLVYEVMETFRDSDAFNAHQRRTRASVWFEATRSILRDFRVEDLRD